MTSVVRKLDIDTQNGAIQGIASKSTLIAATLAASLLASPALAGGSGMPSSH
jgi:hypothetical protein